MGLFLRTCCLRSVHHPLFSYLSQQCSLLCENTLAPIFKLRKILRRLYCTTSLSSKKPQSGGRGPKESSPSVVPVTEHFSSVQFSSVAQSCPTLCDPMNRSTPGLPVHHQLPEFIQTHVHRIHDAIQPSHPLSSPSPPAPNPSQHQSLFQ